MTFFLRLLSDSDKSSSLLEVCSAVREESYDQRIFDKTPEAFKAMPGTPFAYWVSDNILSIFEDMPGMSTLGAQTKCGAGTLDDFRFLRIWWEKSESSDWVPFPKGGSFSPWYDDPPLCVLWKDTGRQLKQFVQDKVGSASRKIQAQEFYFRPGLTWPRRTNGLSFRPMPAGCIFADKGPALLVSDDDQIKLLALLTIMNSRPFSYLVSAQLARTELAQSFEVGLIQQTPIPNFTDAQVEQLSALSTRAYSLKRALETIVETSRSFLLPASLRARLGNYEPAAINLELIAIQEEIDALAFALYGFSENDRLAAKSSESNTSPEGNETELEGASEGRENLPPINQTGSLLSWAIGVAFGRFDWRLATGERLAPSEPEPFDILPSKSPGMSPAGTDPFHRHPGFLVDDPGHPHDISRLVEQVLMRIGEAVPENVRHWIQRDFFALHLQQYSKSRRKAPVYFQVSIPSGKYSIWIYTPSMNTDTFFRIQQDVLGPKIANEERSLTELSQYSRELSITERRDLDNQRRLVEELKQLAQAVKRIAPIFNPNANDGTVLTLAPLWQLAISNQAWQRELQTKWSELQSGVHDWSSVAMHVWPERVVSKCVDDRSIAIAHELDGIFWSTSEAGKAVKRELSTQAISEVIQERTSAAVKAALKEFLEATEPAATVSRSRRKA